MKSFSLAITLILLAGLATSQTPQKNISQCINTAYGQMSTEGKLAMMKMSTSTTIITTTPKLPGRSPLSLILKGPCQSEPVVSLNRNKLRLNNSLKFQINSELKKPKPWKTCKNPWTENAKGSPIRLLKPTEKKLSLSIAENRKLSITQPKPPKAKLSKLTMFPEVKCSLRILAVERSSIN